MDILWICGGYLEDSWLVDRWWIFGKHFVIGGGFVVDIWWIFGGFVMDMLWIFGWRFVNI